MPLVRYGRPGLLGAITRNDVISGNTSMIAEVIRRAARRSQAQPGQGTAAAVAEAEAAVQQAEAEAAAAQHAAERYATRRPEPESAPAAGNDLVGELADLARLRDSGVLSQAEFESVKAKMLGG